jgi:hypothetical protein
MCCVTNLIWKGCFTTCQNIDFGIVAVVDGIHTVQFFGSSGNVIMTKAFTTGQKLQFSLEFLNENMGYTAKIINPSGFNVLAGNDGFSFETKINKSISLP